LERRTLLVCDFEEDYAGQLSAFIKQDELFSWRIIILTGEKEILKFSRWQEVSLALVSETVYEKCQSSLRAEVVIVLSESGLRRWKNANYVDKYCAVDDVYRRIIEIYTEKQDEILEKVSRGGQTKVIGFYSPTGEDMQTPFALTYGQLLSRKNKVIYISFAPFQSYPELKEGEQKEDLMTLLYYLESEKFAVTLRNAVSYIGDLHTISAKSGHNLVYITKEQWLKFVSGLMHYGEYDYILLDLNSGVQGVFDLLDECCSIYTLAGSSNTAQHQLAQYKELLAGLSAEYIMRRSNFLPTPQFHRMPHLAYELTGSELAEYVGMIIRKEAE